MDEVYTFALKNTLDEMENACPEMKNAFIFRGDGEIVTGDNHTPENTIVQAIDALDGLLEKSDALGGVTGITLEQSKGQLKVTSIDQMYLVTATTQEANMKYVNTVTRVLIPTVLRLIENVKPTSLKTPNPSNVNKIALETKLENEITDENNSEEDEDPDLSDEDVLARDLPAKISSDPVMPEITANQFMVENLGGLLVPSDTVRIDNQTLQQWQESSDGKKIEAVEIETFDGKTIQCKVKPMNDQKFEGKGIIRMPEKLQNSLEVKKGELVRVKPFSE